MAMKECHFKGLKVKLAEGTYASAAGKSTKNLKALQSYWQADYHYLLGTAEDNHDPPSKE